MYKINTEPKMENDKSSTFPISDLKIRSEKKPTNILHLTFKENDEFQKFEKYF